MKTEVIKTRILKPPQDDLLGVIAESVNAVPERSVLAITSKVVSIWEGRTVPKKDMPDKDVLIAREADKYLPRDASPHGWVMHTMKHNLFIPSAGVDESNSGDYFVLWPSKPKNTAKKLLEWAKKHYDVNKLGIIITDSHTIPLRRGTMGVSLAHAGFRPTNDYRGTADLFGRELKITLTDVADGLAASAVLAMGEGRESTPLALITEIPFVTFGDFNALEHDPDTSHEIPELEDLYYPLLSSVPWQNGGGGR